MSLGSWMEQRRLALKLSSTECANRAGIRLSEWCRWENDKSRRKGGAASQPRPETLQSIADALETPIEEAYRAMGVLGQTADLEIDLARRLDRMMFDLSPGQRERVARLLEKDCEQYVSLLTSV